MQRLKTRPQFQAVLAGVTVARTEHFALHRSALEIQKQDPPGQVPVASTPLFDAHEVWLGAMVPKRWAKRAVTRNTIKRQIYSVSTHFESTLMIAAHVVRLRSGFDRTKFVSATSAALNQAVREELIRLYSQLTTAVRTSRAEAPV